MDIATLLDSIAKYPSIKHISLVKVMRFMRFASFSRASVEIKMEDNTHPPDKLPQDINILLVKAIGERPLAISQLWSALKEEIWKSSVSASASDEERTAYNLHALPLGTAYRHMYPHTRVCNFHGCKNHRSSNNIRTLTDPRTHKATLFTLREGTIPIYTTSLYCRGCKRRYHHNYSVHSQTNVREYYSGVPEVIQVSQHCFIDSALLEFFSTSKVFGWLSSMNCARIYNQSISGFHSVVLNNPQAFPPDLYVRCSSEFPWQTSLQLQDKDVLNGFFLYSLLLDHAELGSVLHIEHDAPSQKDRLKPALLVRNVRMEGVGQEEYTHACDLCFIVFVDDQGRIMKMRAAICDGDTIGHPCCAVHDCKEPLVNHRQRFCAIHGALNRQCSITDCVSPVQDGFRTCNLPDHRALETAYFQKGKAISQLRRRFKNVAVLPDSVVSEKLEPRANDDDDDEVEEEVVIETESCEGKPETGNRKLKAYFGRRRTHNEQLIIRPCGVILSRATFFGSEAVSSVNAFAKATFPSPESTPEFFVFDNNCQLHKHIQSIKDKHFERTGMPVDVFHFRAKHKESDQHCQLWCNPVAFPELIKEDGKWRINMSICEQVNGWLGGYQAIVRDMEATRYNFYLDELIKRRNRYVVKELIAKGHRPWNVPIDTLFPPQN